MRKRFSAARLGLLADLLKATGDPDPHAIEAARAVGGLLVIPDFGEDRPEGLKDFNDLAVLRGLEVVAECIRRQIDAGERGPEEEEPRPGNGAAEGPLGPEDAPGRDSQDKDGPRDQAGKARADSGIVALEISELLTRRFPPKESLLSPWVRLQDLVMIYSKRGVGKTHLCLALAYAIASGGQFLKWAAPEPRRVLYIDGRDARCCDSGAARGARGR
jgi:hypothetical protein